MKTLQSMSGAELLRSVVEFINSRSESLNTDKTIKDLFQDYLEHQLPNPNHYEYLRALSIVKTYKNQLEMYSKKITKDVDEVVNTGIRPEMKLYDTDAPVRILNVLSANYERLGINRPNSETKVSELSGVSKRALLKCRYFGKTSLRDLEEICNKAGVKLMP